MFKPWFKSFIISLLVFTTFTCIEPYYHKLTGYTSSLVVDGLITNENRPYIIKLSYTRQDKDSVDKRISDATVYISDETGATTFLTSNGDGIYKTDSVSFKGETGKTYQLHIRTSNGTEYESDSCKMLPVPEIDSIYFNKDEILENNQTVLKQGISIYLDSKPGSNEKYFLRWEYEETWKFKIPDPTRYIYINFNNILPIPGSEIKEFCWKSSKSNEILTDEVYSGVSNFVRKKNIKFISPDESDRLTVQYSVLVKQYSVSQKEFNFWNNLKEVNETEGDIFGSVPFAVPSNVKNKDNPSESVAGYFQVSAASEKRKFISPKEIIPLNLPGFNYTCNRFQFSPSDLARNPVTGVLYTWDELYNLYSNAPGIKFVGPLYDQIDGAILKLVFTSVDCADCERTGSLIKPGFWVDN